MRHKLAVLIGSTCLMFFAAASTARADAIIQFVTEAEFGGTLSYAGGSSPLVGSNISISAITGNDTPANAGAYLSITGGLLNFTSGAFLGYSSGFYQFGPGGTFEIIGTVPDAGILSPTTLFSGSLDFSTIGNQGLSSLGVLSGEGVTVNASLLDFFGMSSETFFVLAATEMANGVVGTGQPFSVEVFHSDWEAVDPLTAEAVTPEPASLVLLGSGLWIVGTSLRRRQRTPETLTEAPQQEVS